MKKSGQKIRYVNTRDGVRLAWAESGEGKVLVKAANWMTHLEFDWESSVWRHWTKFFSENFRFIRHDERGCGMTSWQAGDLSFERWVEDLETVIETVAPQEPFALLGMSQGAATCIAYAAKYPERVSHLILYGGYARGTFHREDDEHERFYRAMVELVRLGWGSDNPTFRQIFTSRFVPGASDEQISWFNELCRKTTSPEIAAQLLETRASINVMSLLGKIRTPTLVIHSRGDEVISITEGHILAAGIPNAQFVELDSKNHVLLENEPAWQRFCDEVSSFTETEKNKSENHPSFAALSPREREVLSLVTEGFGNAQIASKLSISEKTVRNHVSNIFDKLGVWTRAQAIVFARDHNFENF